MKNLKKLLMGALTITALSVGFTSCSSDDCDDITCLNEGICNGGICDCIAGYGGTTCETKYADQFVGSWDCTDIAGTDSFDYTATIAVSTSEPTIINITNFGGFSDVLSVTQNTTTTENFYLTGPVTQSGVAISNVDGNISSDGNQIEVTYTSADGTTTVSNAGTWTRL